MKANRGQIERALDAPTPDIRLFLLHGPDESGSRALAERLARAMGADAERIDLDGGAVARDPALLADEAASMSLFGGPRHIRLKISGDEALDAIEALLEAEQAGNPVVAVAGALKGTSKLLKRALAAANVMAFASYVPEGADADRMVMALARDSGLRMTADVARRVVDATGGDRALLTREIEKLALYVDAAPERPGEIGHDALDAVGVDSGDGDLSRLVDGVMSGQPDAAVRELERLAVEGIEGMPLIRAVLRRIFTLMPLRSEIDGGASVDDVMASSGKALFWKEKPVISRQVRRWDSPRLAIAQSRLLEAERQLKSAGTAGPILVAAELVAISRVAARLR